MPDHTPSPTHPRPRADQPAAVAFSVWPTGHHRQTPHRRRHGYVPGTRTDLERIPPDLAAYAITTYSHPADTVLDPGCGAGTVLVEALRAGRHAVGLTRGRWWGIARANLTTTKRAGAWPDATLLDAHPRTLTTARAAGLTGRIGLVLTTLRHSHPCTTVDERRTDPRPGLLLPRLAQALTGCIPLLRPGARVIITIRRRRHHGMLEDLPSAVLAAGHTAGLVPVQRCIAPITPLRGTQLSPRASLAQHDAAAQASAASIPVTRVAHHDVLVFAAPDHTEQRNLGMNGAALAEPPPLRWSAQNLSKATSPKKHHGRHAA
jgi:modification methylase